MIHNSRYSDYFLYIIKKHESITSNEESPLLIYPNRIKTE